MKKKDALKKLKKVLTSKSSGATKAAKVTEIADDLPEKADRLIEDRMDGAEPLVQVALMDAHFEITGDKGYKNELLRILDAAEKLDDKGEELYMAARLALGRLTGLAQDGFGEWGDAGFEVRAMAEVVEPEGIPSKAKGAARRERITIIIHGTWAANGTWWRPKGDFFEYVKKELGRKDIYGEPDQFEWSGKNRDSSRRKASASLDKWLRSHRADEVNVFAHSHGANIAMLATHRQTYMDRLIMLSPPVRDKYFADWKYVGNAYNIQAKRDPVVAIARGGTKFPKKLKLKLKKKLKEKVLKASGHSSTHDPDVWRAEKLAKFVKLPRLE